MAQTKTLATEPILDLTTVVHRSLVRIDGKKYELKSPEEFALLDYRSKTRKYDRLGFLFRKKRLTSAESKEQQTLLDEFCRAILEAPDAVHDKLVEPQRIAVVTAFFLSSPGASDALAKTNRTTGKRRTAKRGR